MTVIQSYLLLLLTYSINLDKNVANENLAVGVIGLSQLFFHRCTRSSITDIVLPKFHLGVAKKSHYHGASLFNSLPMNIKTLSPMDRFQAFRLFVLRLSLEQFFKSNLIIMRILFFFFYELLNDIFS